MTATNISIYLDLRTAHGPNLLVRPLTLFRADGAIK
jgi:hypothetical protein